tara:strand:+ start:3452 stop:5266 length:1815 start_codon:yes stop_codon:yes gene_type:complete
MRARKLTTENRILRQIAGSELSVDLGEAVSAAFNMPTMTSLLSNKIEQNVADTNARRQVFLDMDAVLEEEQIELEKELASETDPQQLERLRNRAIEVSELLGTTKTDRFQKEILEIGAYRTPEELTEKFGEIITFNRAMSEEEAALLVQNKKEEIIRGAIIQAGPKGFVPGVAKFAGGMAAMATDPLELGSMFIPMVGATGRATSIARYGKVRGNVVVGAKEGAFGSAITEPFYYGLSVNQQLDYTMSEALFNVGAGLFLGGAIGGGIGTILARSVNEKEVLDISDFGEIIEARKAAEPISEAEALARADKIVKNLRKANKITGDHITYDLALRQFITDQNITADIIRPRAVKRPATLGEFIKSKGGVVGDGELIAIKAVDTIVKKNGTAVNFISNDASDLNIDDMAELAFEAGYLDSRNADELVQKIKDEDAGDYTFSKVDQEQADLWRAYHRGEKDFDKEIDFRNEVREELKAIGHKNVTDDEVAAVADRMARTGEMVEDAAQAIAIKVEDVRQEMLARLGLDPENEKLADFSASERADDVSDVTPYDEIIEREAEIVAQARASGELSEQQIKELDEIAEIDKGHEARVDVIRAGMACVVRS